MDPETSGDGPARKSSLPGPDPGPGRGAAGRYRIRAEVARGRTGAILEIEDHSLDRSVAMKVVLEGADPAQLGRFVNEARITGRLEHPNIVPVHDLGVMDGFEGETRHGGSGIRPYFTMKLVRGEPLENTLARIARGDEAAARAFPLSRRLGIFLKVCDAVAFAHARGIVHGGLGAEHVMVGDFGEVLVMDWGLARKVQAESPAGSADPASPDVRADIQALGALLARILTPRPSAEGEGNAAAAAELESVCRRATETGTRDRYRDVSALAADVTAYLEHRPVTAHRYGPWLGFVRLVQRHPAAGLAFAAAAVLVPLLGAVSGMLWARAQGNAALERMQAARVAGEMARAEGEALRAERAEVARTRAERRAVSAEDALEKGRQVSAVLRAAERELADVLGALRASHHSPDPSGAYAEPAHPVWNRVEAFESSLPAAPASKAAWLAVKAWLFHLARRGEDRDRAFRQARETDSLVATAALFEAMTELSRYLFEQRLPPILIFGSHLTLGAMPQESDSMRGARLRFVALLDEVRKTPVWGDSSAKEFGAVLEGLRALQEGDLAAADAGLTSAVAVREMFWILPELRYARARVRYLRQEFEGGLEDVREVVRALPLDPLPRLYEGDLLTALTARRDAALGDLQGLHEAVACYDRSLELLPDNEAALTNRALARIQLTRILLERGEAAVEPIEAALRDCDAAYRVLPTPGALVNRAEARRLGAVIARIRREDPGPLYRAALEDLETVLARDPESPPARLARAAVLKSRGEFELESGLDGTGSIAEALDDARRAAPGLLREADCALLVGEIELALARARMLRREDATEDFAAAERTFTAALCDDAGTPSLFASRGSCRLYEAEFLRYRGKDPLPVLETAVADLDASLERRPRSYDALRSRGLARMKIAEVQRQRGLDPTALLNASLADLDGALEIMSRGIGALVDRAEAHLQAAEWAFSCGRDPRADFEKAAADATRAIEIHPGRSDPWRLRARARWRMAVALRGEDPAPLFAQAVSDATEALRIQPKNALALEDRANARQALGRACMVRGSIAEGMGLFRAALEDGRASVRAAPGYAQAHIAAGRAGISLAMGVLEPGEDRRGILRAAVADFQKAADLDPSSWVALNYLGSSKMHLARVLEDGGEEPRALREEAVAHLDEGLRLLPGNTTLLLNRAQARLDLGRQEARAGGEPRPHLERAVEDCRTLLGHNPRFPQAHHFLGEAWVALAQGAEKREEDPRPHLQKALAAFSDAVRTGGMAAMYLRGLGTAYRNLAFAEGARGNASAPLFEKALVGYREAARGSPGDSAAWSGMGEVLEELGRFGESVEAYSRALAGSEPTEEAREGLARAREASNGPPWLQCAARGHRAAERGEWSLARAELGNAAAGAVEGGIPSDPAARRDLAKIRYRLACLAALASKGLRAPRAEPGPVTEEDAGSLRAEALASLRAALELGYRDFDAARREPAFETLRAGPDFDALLAAFEKG